MLKSEGHVKPKASGFRQILSLSLLVHSFHVSGMKSNGLEMAQKTKTLLSPSTCTESGRAQLHWGEGSVHGNSSHP